MNRNKKILSSVLSGVLATSMITPALAATNDTSVIDYERTGTLNIHKIIENDGTLKNADGTAVTTDAVALDNIGFDYVRIADIENTVGIVVSENGKVTLGKADSTLSGEVAVGLYFKANDKLDALMQAAEIFPEPTYILQENVNSPEGTLQYEFNDDVANSLLSTEQAAVDAAKAALDTARSDFKTAQNNYSTSKAESQLANQNQANAQTAFNDATAKQAAAEAAAQRAAEDAETAATNFGTASTKYTDASTTLTEAQADFDAKLAAYDTGDTSTLKELQTASDNLRTATEQAKAAAEAASDAKAAYDTAADKLAEAQKAFDAAQTILTEAGNAYDGATTGEPDSKMGAYNATIWAQTQMDNAKAYLDDCQDSFDAAEAASQAADTADENAKTALTAATQALENATTANDTAYAAFSTSLQALKTAQTELNAASAAKDTAENALDSANTKKTNADNAFTEANTALANAQTALNNATTTNTNATGDLDNKEATKNTKKADFEAAMTDYINAVAALDAAAEANGIIKCYTVEALENAWQKAITTLSEEYIAEWVAANAPTAGATSEGYTDDNGVVTFSGLPLGLYVVAETDISYHDGIAGAWNDDAAGGFINNDQMNTYGGGVYTIQPIDAFGNGTAHTYAAGEVYRESVNPEAPVVESKSAPFLVSLPQTRTTDADAGAAGDNVGSTGTVWQYTIDVYPKNQTTAIYKRIVDPDENNTTATLRTSEDYQIGDLIESIIWADAPVLQKNYLFDANDEGFGDGLEGDLNDRDDAEDSTNKHIGYVIADTMDEGLSFGGVTRVAIIPKSQLAGTNEEKYIYTDGNGAIVDAGEAMEGGALKTVVKYYDNNNHEISAAQFAERTGVTSPNFYSDIDNDGVDQGDTANIYNAAGNYTGTYYATRISYKQAFLATGSSSIPATRAAFDIVYDASDSEGIILDAADYVVIDTDTQEVRLSNSEGDISTVVPSGTHGWAVQLTEAGLAKLNARTVDSVVVVYFDTILNDNAKIGQVSENMDYATLHYVNTNTGFYVDSNGEIKGARKVSSNEVYHYTYELQIQKEGVIDGNNVKFIVSRDDVGDIIQDSTKDLTDSVSQVRNYGESDSMKFVKESDGVYHVYGYLATDDESDIAGSFETSVVNGVTYNTLTPAKDGSLIIKGIDSNDYTFQEIKTEDENNLLANTFTVSIRATDSITDSARNGQIAKATVKSGNSDNIDITIGVVGVSANDSLGGQKNLGIASMVVNNFDAVDLRTGGAGRTMIYVCGVAMLAGLSVGLFISKKKRNAENDTEE